MSILNAPYIRLDEIDVELYRHIRDQGPTPLTEFSQWFPHVAATTLIHRIQRMARAGLFDSSDIDGHLVIRLHPLGQDRLQHDSALRNMMLRAMFH